MTAELLGYIIIRKSDFKKVQYIGISHLKNRKFKEEAQKAYKPSKYLWVEYKHISSPKTSMYSYRK